jgi:hypothetical protein
MMRAISTTSSRFRLPLCLMSFSCGGREREESGRKARGEPKKKKGNERDRSASEDKGRDGHPAGRTDGRGAGNDAGNGRFLLKQVRAHMMATGRPRLEALVEEAVGVKLVSVHHDISTVTGEEVLVFSLAAPPACRPKKKI